MRLVYERGAERIAFPIEEGETYIGRKEYCDIYFPDGSLSKRHCRLVRRGAALTLFDAGSKNGTLLNGQVATEAPLRNGDVIQCGKLRFVVEGIPGGGSVDDFELVDDPPPARGRDDGPPSARRSGARAPLPPGGVQVARAVASVDARPSMLDVLPELPPSTEDAGGRGRAGPARARLRLVEGGPEEVWDLSGATITLGSKPENAVVLRGEGISRYHAEVLLQDGVWTLKDLGSRNGLFVAGLKVDIHALADGDEIQVGTAKLRFEVVQPGPLAALLGGGSPLRNPLFRMGAAALVVAVLLVFMALPGPGGDGPGQGAAPLDLSWVEEGTAHLQQGDYRVARDKFRMAKARVANEQQELPKMFEELAEQWITYQEQGAMAFRWQRTAELLARASAIEGLPASARGWLAKQTTWVGENLVAYEQLSRAVDLSRRATELGNQEFEAALQAYEQALTAYRDVPAGSLFVEPAAEGVAVTRRQAYDLVVLEIERRRGVATPRWDELLAVIGRGHAYATTPEDRARLRRASELCETNRRDEDLYAQALAIVQVRDPRRYGEAIQLLEQIDASSSISEDARGYLAWIQADLDVRGAQEAYNSGDGRRAFQLLERALQQGQVLGPAAKESVFDRQKKWSRVVQAYDRGMRLFQAGQADRAREEFETVLQLEPNRNNVYHTRARDQLTHMSRMQSAELDRKLRRGLEALENNQYDAALQWFGEVKEDPARTDRDLDTIRTAVTNHDRARRLFRNAERDFVRDRQERFVELRHILRLLGEWLPADHPDREAARRYWADVDKRLQALRTPGRPR